MCFELVVNCRDELADECVNEEITLCFAADAFCFYVLSCGKEAGAEDMIVRRGKSDLRSFPAGSFLYEFKAIFGAFLPEVFFMSSTDFWKFS